MSPESEARAALARLVAETGDDLATARDQTRRISQLLAEDAAWVPGDPRLAVAALALHHRYTAIESILERVARVFEGGLPSGPDWHRELLHGATLMLEGVRPAVLGHASEVSLYQLLRFRHFLRHGYAAELDGVRLRALAAAAVASASEIEADLEAFRDHLRSGARSLGG